MTPKQYVKNVFKTLSRDRKAVGDQPAQKGPKYGLRQIMKAQRTIDIYHAAIGIHTEVGELIEGQREFITSDATFQAKINLYEELGDLAYYTAVLCHRLGIDHEGGKSVIRLPAVTKYVDALMDLHKIGVAIGDLTKKPMYGRDFDIQALEALVREFQTLLWATAGSLLGVSPAQLRTANIAKLAVRYKDGRFVNEAEKARNVDAEIRAMLEAQ